MPSGIYIRTEEIRKKTSESLKGNIPWNKGKKGLYTLSLTEEEIERKRLAFSGENNPNFKRTFSEITRKKMSIACKGRVFTEEWKKNLGAVRKGKKHTEATKLKMSLAKKGSSCYNWNGGKYLTKRGYVMVLMPEHPFANQRGYIMEHRIVMESIIGRYLTPEEVVHHDGEKNDNRIEKLKLFVNQAKHLKYHEELIRQQLCVQSA